MQFIDTNIFLRYFIEENPQKTEACYQLFKKAQENKIILTTSESVIAEVVYVLISKRNYHLQREKIRELLLPILSLTGLKLSNKETYVRALDILVEQSVDFEDALSVAHMEQQNIQEIISYDTDFNKFHHITRKEP
jgi:predicted nucleic acid-binding protein